MAGGGLCLMVDTPGETIDLTFHVVSPPPLEAGEEKVIIERGGWTFLAPNETADAATRIGLSNCVLTRPNYCDRKNRRIIRSQRLSGRKRRANNFHAALVGMQ